MILLKANDKLKAVFQKIIKTIGEKVEWTDIFLINNNDLILLGRVRSLFFNFDNRKVNSNIIDITINEEAAIQIADNELLENTLNMTLYTFGKWGGIKGLKVEKDYDQLNKLLQYIFQDIHIESSLTKDNLRFYKEGVQIAYEEIIQIILDQKKPEENKEEVIAKEEQEEQEEQEDAKEDSDYSLGLWHNMLWKGTKLSFVKEEISESDKVKSRLGNDFYMVNYKCPACEEKLYMVVFPMGEEFRIETDDGGVFLARAYTCSSCKSFYTPKPQQLLSEGEVYELLLEEDPIAYEDYQELLGKQGEKTSNCNFNEYETDYLEKNKIDPPSLDEECSEIDALSEEEIEELKDKIDSGFYPEEDIDKYKKLVEQEAANRKLFNRKENKNEKPQASEKEYNKIENKGKKIVLGEDRDEAEIIKKGGIKNKHKPVGKHILQNESDEMDENKRVGKLERINSQTKPKGHSSNEMLAGSSFVNLKELVTSLLKGEDNLFHKALETLSKEQLSELRFLIQSEPNLNDKEKEDKTDQINRQLYKEKEAEILQKAVDCKGKSYAHIVSVMNDLKEEEITERVKTSVLDFLKQLLEKTGKKELEKIVSKIPANVSKKQYQQFMDKIEAYTEIDRNLSKKLLEEKRDEAEKQEISAFMKRANPRNRKAYLETYDRLKEQKFEDQNVIPVLEKIRQKVYDMDVAAIERICKEPADLTFEEGLKAYDEILLGEYLPDLKGDVLSQIDKRLTKLKVDECDQLVNKLSKDLSTFMREDSRIYFYQARKMMLHNLEDADSIIIQNALKSYAEKREKYEYPIMVGDTSYAGNGESGFVLTPNHIFYRSFLSTGIINIMDIEEVSAHLGMIKKGIYISHSKGRVKIANSLQVSELKAVSRILNDFVSYLKEKPESRNVSYMAKEVHKVKCCYRCGYVYKEGNVCPKCGSKMNE